MWRADGLYDLVVVMGYNDRPRVKGRGSAVFMHVARPGMLPTEGCVALARPHLERLLRAVKRNAVVSVRPLQRSSENKKRPGMPKHRAEFRARLGEGARSGEDAGRAP
jgi:hypothetical protein